MKRWYWALSVLLVFASHLGWAAGGPIKLFEATQRRAQFAADFVYEASPQYAHNSREIRGWSDVLRTVDALVSLFPSSIAPKVTDLTGLSEERLREVRTNRILLLPKEAVRLVAALIVLDPNDSALQLCRDPNYERSLASMESRPQAAVFFESALRKKRQELGSLSTLRDIGWDAHHLRLLDRQQKKLRLLLRHSGTNTVAKIAARIHAGVSSDVTTDAIEARLEHIVRGFAQYSEITPYRSETLLAEGEEGVVNGILDAVEPDWRVNCGDLVRPASRANPSAEPPQ